MEKWQQKLRLLEQNNLSIIVEKNCTIVYQSADPMLKPLLDCLHSKDDLLKDATVIDKVTGLAAAYLCWLGGVKMIMTPLTSISAKEFLTKKGIPIEAARTIPQIKNRQNTGPCPMEQLALSSSSAEDFYKNLLAKINATHDK
jgi:hypothetical protein